MFIFIEQAELLNISPYAGLIWFDLV